MEWTPSSGNIKSAETIETITCKVTSSDGHFSISGYLENKSLKPDSSQEIITSENERLVKKYSTPIFYLRVDINESLGNIFSTNACNCR